MVAMGIIGAGSAVIKPDKVVGVDPNKKLQEIFSDIEQFLRQHVQPELTAAQIMSMPVKIILPTVSMEEAGKIMIRYNLDGLLVAEKQELLGVIGKRDVDQARHHRLGHASVSGFMSRPVITIKPDMPFSEIQALMVRNNIGRLPVMNEAGQLLGIVSRTDVLKTLFDKSSLNAPAAQVSPSPRIENIRTHHLPVSLSYGADLGDGDAPPAANSDFWLHCYQS